MIGTKSLTGGLALAVIMTGSTGSVSPAQANTIDCMGLYVGRVWVEKGYGLYGAVFLDHPDNSSGSYWQFFTGWSAEEKKSALATLTTAKITQHRVDVATEASGGCSIQSGAQTLKSVLLSNRP